MDEGTNSAQSRNEPAAHLTISRTSTVIPLSLSDMWTPHVIIKLQPKNQPVTVPPRSNPLPSSISFIA
jgi:hypothetical protein